MFQPVSIVLVNVLLAYVVGTAGAAATEDSYLPNRTFTTLAGGNWRPGSGGSQVTVLHFWSLSCRPCIEVLPRLRRLHGAWAGRTEVALVGLPVEGDLVRVRRHVRRHHMAWPQLTHAEGSAVRVVAGPLAVKVIPTPSFWIIDEAGKIVGVCRDPEAAFRLAEGVAVKLGATVA